jgi:hypothetical protein
VRIVYSEEHHSMESAIARERQLKRWTANMKEALIAGDFRTLKSRSKRRRSCFQASGVPHSSTAKSLTHSAHPPTIGQGLLMGASRAYGFAWGLLFVLLGELNSPVAWAVFWAVCAVESSIYSTLTWRRTRMVWMTIGGVHASLVQWALVPASLAGYTLVNLPSPWNVVFWVNALTVPLMLGIAWIVEREKFRLWKQHQQGMSLLDMLNFRHIPDL